MLKLRDYQEEGVANIRDSFIKGSRSPMFVLSTGGGKTVMFCDIARKTSLKSKRVLILVHRVELLRQTSESLYKSNVHHGLINPLYTPDLMASVQIASVQTLIRRLDKVLPPDLIIIDECHHGNAGSWKKIINYFDNSKILGFTATPKRGDGRGLDDVFDDLIMGPQISELIERGYLVSPRLFGNPNPIDFSNVKIIRGDYDKDEAVELMDRPTITGSAVSEYTRLCPGAPAVAFCISVKHAEHVAADFRSAGYRAYSVDGSMDDETRTRILKGLGNGNVQIVTSCDLISEGTDIPAILCAIMLRPTKSTGLYIQQGGRALRPIYADGYDLNTNSGRLNAISASKKPQAIILDHVGNFKNHGYLNQDRYWTLEGRKKGERRKKNEEIKINVKQCENCYAVYEPSLSCPYCGHENTKQEKEPLIIEGDLQEIDTKEAQRVEKVKRRTRVAQTRTLDGLLKLEKEFGYKSGWAMRLFKARNDKLI